MNPPRAVFIWAPLAVALVTPFVLAADSPQLAWREPIYIVAGFAGIVGLGLLLVQPVLAAGWLPGIPVSKSRRVHRWTGGALVAAVLVHVGGLWITSPPDVVDALLLRSPTPFSVWGVIAMWVVFLAAFLAAMRRVWKLRPQHWRRIHVLFGVWIAIGTIIHALQIEGTMEPLSKLGLCVLVGAATLKVFVDRWGWSVRWPGKAKE